MKILIGILAVLILIISIFSYTNLYLPLISSNNYNTSLISENNKLKNEVKLLNDSLSVTKEYFIKSQSEYESLIKAINGLSVSVSSSTTLTRRY